VNHIDVDNIPHFVPLYEVKRPRVVDASVGYHYADVIELKQLLKYLLVFLKPAYFREILNDYLDVYLVFRELKNLFSGFLEFIS
jgi:hypothetical protein